MTYNILNTKIMMSVIKTLYCLVAIILLSANSSWAASGNTQLLRNATLETANIDKALNSLKNTTSDNKQTIKKAKELEGVFLSVMMEPMFPEGKDSDLYGGHTGSGVFRTLMVQEYGKILSDAGGIGLAKEIEKQLLRNQ